jgi:hypothetical protein
MVIVHVSVDEETEVIPSQLFLHSSPLPLHRAGAEPRVDDDQAVAGCQNGHVGSLEVVASPCQKDLVTESLQVYRDRLLPHCFLLPHGVPGRQ